MAEATKIDYELKELTELMLRDRGITKGHWMIVLAFIQTAGTIDLPDGCGPFVMNRVTKIGISRIDQPNPISVDASELSKGASSQKRQAKTASA